MTYTRDYAPADTGPAHLDATANHDYERDDSADLRNDDISDLMQREIYAAGCVS